MKKIVLFMAIFMMSAAEPCIGAFIHKDEMAKNKNGNVKPHMHYLMSNLVFDKKKNRYKFCCKEVINKKDLRLLIDKI